jgi:hypothetical protein
MNFREINKRGAFKNGLIAILLLAVIGLGIYVVFHKNSSYEALVTEEKVQIAPSGIAYPDGWTEATEITASNKDAGVVAEASHTNPDVKVVVREQETTLPNNFDISGFPDVIVAKLEDTQEEFKSISKEVIKIGSYDVVRVKYTDLDANQVKHTSEMFVVPTPKKTFYINYRSSKDFSELNNDIAKINQSIANYIKSH